MGYGSGPFGGAPLGTTSLPPEDETFAALSSSRKIDFVTKRYVTNEDGGFDPMDDVAQRVMLIISFAVKEQKVITAQDNADTAARIRAALGVLTKGPTPTIKVIDLAVTDNGKASTLKSLTYKNMLTGTQQTLLPDGKLVVLP
jgi:hypothetical protein